MMDVSKTIVAKSDQLNADDLIAGPRTVKIRAVENPGGDQPLHVYYEGDDGKPFKPSLTARRVLISIWGSDAERWVGMSLTLYNDETVKWAGQEVGGIRVSHMEGLSKSRTLNLTATRGKKKPVTIEPLFVERAKSQADKYRERLFAVAEDAEKSVEDVWPQVPEAIREELGADLYDQLIAIEQAAADHRENDPDAAAQALNESLE